MLIPSLLVEFPVGGRYALLLPIRVLLNLHGGAGLRGLTVYINLHQSSSAPNYIWHLQIDLVKPGQAWCGTGVLNRCCKATYIGADVAAYG